MQLEVDVVDGGVSLALTGGTRTNSTNPSKRTTSTQTDVHVAGSRLCQAMHLESKAWGERSNTGGALRDSKSLDGCDDLKPNESSLGSPNLESRQNVSRT